MPASGLDRVNLNAGARARGSAGSEVSKWPRPTAAAARAAGRRVAACLNVGESNITDQ
jgi:hypothetical protein